MACVKTAISIQESLFKEAEELARKLQVSRSKLVSLALEEYVEKNHAREILTELNKVHSEPMDEADRAFVEGSRISLARLMKDDEW